MQNLYKDLIQELSKNEKFLLQGQVSASLVRDRAYKLDPELIGLLFGNERLKQEFFDTPKIKDFDPLEGVKELPMIFNYPKFAKFITNKEFLPDSYTEFESNIGLSVGDKFLSESKEVVLSFPFKDCILEGGMDTEEAKNRKEIFYNQTLAPDDIHKLKSPKALKNWKRYSAGGVKKFSSIEEYPQSGGGVFDAQNNTETPRQPTVATPQEGNLELKLNPDGTFNENFIIKGNNLLALYSLLPRYKGKIKLIYIDPPYNTRGSGDTFSYNNSFKRSSWLTFMKNRLEAAKQLLCENGVIITAIDDYEHHTLRFLLDEIYGSDNRLGTVVVVHNPRGRNDDKYFATMHEYLLVYAKNINLVNLKNFDFNENDLKQFNKLDDISTYSETPFTRTGNNSNKHERPNLFYPIYYEVQTNSLSLQPTEASVTILPINSEGEEKTWRWGKETFEAKKSTELLVKKVKGEFKIFKKRRASDIQGKKPRTVWNDSKYDASSSGIMILRSLLGKNEFSYPKSLYAVIDIIKILSDENDIILDFHAGSGTTAHAVLELNKEDGGNRKFILVEQMDYINTVTCPRVQKVMENQKEEASLFGESRQSFIYLELAKNNIIYLEKIESLENGLEAWSLFEELSDSIWISYRVDIDKFKEHKDEFLALKLEDQKKVLRDIINYNHLYVNYEDMEDIAYKDCGLTDEDKALTTQFYEKKQADQNQIL